MARKGLGKGLDSLIPDIYNEDFDSNSSHSLDDMLKGKDVEEISDVSEENSDDLSEDNVQQDSDVASQSEDAEVDSSVGVSEDSVQDTNVVEESSVDVSENSDVGKNTSVNDDIQDDTTEDSDENISDDKLVNNDYSEEVREVESPVEKDSKIVDKSSTEEVVAREDNPKVVRQSPAEDVSKEVVEEVVREEISEVVETPVKQDLASEKESSPKSPTKKILEEIENQKQEFNYNPDHVEEVKKIVDKNPRITLWSSKSSAVFRYLRKTEPEFSISKEASRLIEDAVSKKYPEIWALFADDE